MDVYTLETEVQELRRTLAAKEDMLYSLKKLQQEANPPPSQPDEVDKLDLVEIGRYGRQMILPDIGMAGGPRPG